MANWGQQLWDFPLPSKTEVAGVMENTHVAFCAFQIDLVTLPVPAAFLSTATVCFMSWIAKWPRGVILNALLPMWKPRHGEIKELSQGHIPEPMHLALIQIILLRYAKWTSDPDGASKDLKKLNSKMKIKYIGLLQCGLVLGALDWLPLEMSRKHFWI